MGPLLMQPGASARSVLGAQLVAGLLAAAAAGMVGGVRMAASAGYGALLMALLGLQLARRVAGVPPERIGRARGVLIAAGRFVSVFALLALGHAVGLWLPGVAGGMAAAQAALFFAGFRLMAGESARMAGGTGRSAACAGNKEREIPS
ncbi:MAG: hypothetical protein D6682_00530 [Zetaproteobacteria bacterium]|nr:MAG: hypothetical protein D6682_00530 [Zetaproteobacteria bacterium]